MIGRYVESGQTEKLQYASLAAPFAYRLIPLAGAVLLCILLLHEIDRTKACFQIKFSIPDHMYGGAEGLEYLSDSEAIACLIKTGICFVPAAFALIVDLHYSRQPLLPVSM